MLAVPEQPLTDALQALDPVSRALVDLSVRRGIPDDEIASIVGSDTDRVAERRDDVLREIADAVGLAGEADDLARVRDALKQIDWRAHSRPAAANGPAGEAERQGGPRRLKPSSDAALARAPEPRNLWVLIAAALLSLLALRRRGQGAA